jgi:guanylate kinase
MKREGITFIISAPSGAGKTTLCRELLDFFPEMRHSVSFTTRQIRPGEVEGRDYYYVSREEFLRMVDAGEFAEWAEVHGNLYGTALSTLETCRNKGIDLILDIDCQGGRQLKQKYGGGVFIFVLPPSMEELQRRLCGRESDSEEVIRRRLANAESEIRESRWYDYIVVNDEFSQALEEMKSIVRAEQCRTSRVRSSVCTIFEI